MSQEAKLAATLQTLLCKIGFSQRIENIIGRGTPDMVFLHGGKTFWIELKSGDGTCCLRHEQNIWQMRALACDVEVFTIFKKHKKLYVFSNFTAKKETRDTGVFLTEPEMSCAWEDWTDNLLKYISIKVANANPNGVPTTAIDVASTS